MIVGNFKIHVVCANEIEPYLYGDIYDDVSECKHAHPDEYIIYGFYVERISHSNHPTKPEAEETPDWFYTIQEAVDWCNQYD